MDKSDKLKHTLYKLMVNKPYNVVRNQCGKIARQISELERKNPKKIENNT